MELPTATLSVASVRPTRHTLCTIANGAIGLVVSGSRQLECGTQALGPVHGLVGHGQYTGEGIGMGRSEEHTSELQSLMRISYAVFCLKNKINSYYQTISVLLL